MTVGEFREQLLDDSTIESELRTIQRAIIPEIAAAVAKIMSNKDLVLAAARIRNVTRCRNTMGERGVLGIRVQPNHPVDDIGGILLTAFEGLLYGCGDAVIGVNPAADSVETVGAILHALDRLVTRAKRRRKLAAWRIFPHNSRRWAAVRPLTCCFNPSAARKRRTKVSASHSRCCTKAANK